MFSVDSMDVTVCCPDLALTVLKRDFPLFMKVKNIAYYAELSEEIIGNFYEKFNLNTYM